VASGSCLSWQVSEWLLKPRSACGLNAEDARHHEWYTESRTKMALVGRVQGEYRRLSADDKKGSRLIKRAQSTQKRGASNDAPLIRTSMLRTTEP